MDYVRWEFSRLPNYFKLRFTGFQHFFYIRPAHAAGFAKRKIPLDTLNVNAFMFIGNLLHLLKCHLAAYAFGYHQLFSHLISSMPAI